MKKFVLGVAIAVLALSAQAERKLKPEMLVRFPQSSIGCLTQEALTEVMLHFFMEEKTKAMAMFIGPKNPHGQCAMLSETMTYKILSVDADDDGNGHIEIIRAGNPSPNGFWTLGNFARPVK